MAHERIDIDLPLAKVYELLSNPVEFPKFLSNLDTVTRINSQTFEYKTKIGGEQFQWTTNLIDNLRNTRFAWITINGNLNQTGTIRFTPLENGTKTRVEFSLDYRTFFGDPSADLQTFIGESPERLKKDLANFKKLAEDGTFKETKLEPSEEVTA